MSNIRQKIAMVSRRAKRGQILIMFVICVPVLIGLCGLGIDIGMLYLTSARLSRAADASAIRLAKYFTTDTTMFRTKLIKTMESNSKDMPAFLTSDFTGDGLDPETFTASKDGMTLSYQVITNAFATGSTSSFPQPLDENSTYDWEDNPGPDRGGWDVSPPGAYLGVPYDSSVLTSDYSDLEVITVRIKVTVEHDNFFMPAIGGPKTITLSEETEAKKYPGVTILILDDSQSMDAGNPRAYKSLRDSVDIFLEQFDETRDFMGVVYFSNKGWISYPESAPFVPRLNWDPRISELVQNAGNEVNGYCMNPQTHATEAMRLAFNMVENFLSAFDTAERSSIPVSYVFFTDGGFTSVRTFCRGKGFGGTSGTSLGSGTIHTKSKVPWFHGVKPVNYPSDGLAGLKLTPYKKDGSRKNSTDYDLEDLIENLDVDLLAGINGNIHRWSMSIGKSGSKNVDTNYKKTHNIQTGTGDYEDVPYGGHFWELGSNPSVATPVMLPYDPDKDKDEDENKDYWDYAENETDKNNDTLPFSFPARIQSITQNWTTDSNTSTAPGTVFSAYSSLTEPYYYHRRSSNTANRWPALPTDPDYKGRDIPNDELEWNRGLALYRNTHGAHNHIGKSYSKDLYGGYQAYLNRPGQHDRLKRYANRTIHTQMLYPEYRMGGDLDSDDNASPELMWSWKKKQWIKASSSNVLAEADFVMEAQCLIARVKHNATIFCIILGSKNTNDVHYNMANTNESGTAALYSDQNQGGLYETDDPQELRSIFAEVAAQIVVRITE